MALHFENHSHITTISVRQLCSSFQRIVTKSCSFLILFFFFALFTTTTFSQEKKVELPKEGTEPGANSGNKPVEQGIRVTGKKDPRDREILRTPNSISRLNEQDIQDAGINRTNDIDKQVPNFSIIDSGSRNFTYFNIRGMRSIAFSEPAVGLILDGIPLNDNVALNTELYGLENIEVYRGSQATLFGKNFQGGVVEIRTKKPTNVAEGKITYDVGNYKKQEISTYYNAPIIKDTLYFGIAGKTTEREGYLSNITGFYYPNNRPYELPVELYKTHPDGRKGKAGRFRLFFTPNEIFEADLQVSAESFDDGSLNLVNYLGAKSEREKALLQGCVAMPSNCSKLYGTYVNRVNGDRKVYWDYEGKSNVTGNTYSLATTTKLPHLNLKTASAIRKMDIDPITADADFTTTDQHRSIYVEKATTFLNDVYLESKDKNDPLQFKVGVYSSNKITNIDQAREHRVQMYVGNDFGGLRAPARERNISRVQDRNLSFYTHNSYTFAEKFTVTLGSRLERQESRMSHTEQIVGFSPINPYGETKLLSDPYTINNHYNYNVSRFIFDYKPIENLMFFIGFSRGYKNAGYSTVVNIPDKAAFKPEINDTIEAGVKSEFFKGKFGLKYTQFYTETQNFHVVRAINLSQYINLNAEMVTIRGYELETFIKPHKDAKLGLSAGYTEGLFNKFYDSVLNRDFNGKWVHFIPKYDIVSYLQYRNEFGIFFRGEFQAVGQMYFAADNTVYSDPYYVMNARVGYETDTISAYLYMNNINDRYYFTSYIDGTFQAVPGAPKTYGFMLTYKI
ncbi:TonB-dependent receptor [Leptospira congkakensis]|uniref:TonB-dependent receptor n=1 Tax=Leptospira congkakensis TaxID=2484932 RepID=A0A4Z1AF97_9LEPT|nr:TonB-dependent receptor [Leptospira congkakensis]TGL88765.1 TonB-dependent receptor [Leptospira congkakensis]TGL89351.1 TonB-dependent receptor [Leptospira congkakensis]TGL97319.1 TonB-dependent receptor [Leptospira congkakensis]